MISAAMASPLPWLRPSLPRISTTIAMGIATSAPMQVQPKKDTINAVIASPFPASLVAGAPYWG